MRAPSICIGDGGVVQSLVLWHELTIAAVQAIMVYKCIFSLNCKVYCQKSSDENPVSSSGIVSVNELDGSDSAKPPSMINDSCSINGRI